MAEQWSPQPNARRRRRQAIFPDPSGRSLLGSPSKGEVGHAPSPRGVRGTRGTHLSVTALVLRLLGCGVVVVLSTSVVGAVSDPVTQVLSYHLMASSKPAPAQYLAQVQHYSDEIASDIGHPLSLPLSVVVNSTQVQGNTTLAYTEPLDSSGQNTDGPVAGCRDSPESIAPS